MAGSDIDFGEYFARLTAEIEDAHSTASEGQVSGLCRDERRILAAHLKCQLQRVDVLLNEVTVHLQAQ